ncbi:MAG: heavy metal translocating P-type ATPase [Gammaproteobacteria bacterium]
MSATDAPRPCFHCGEPCPDDPSLTVLRDGERLPVCCTGCKAVAELIFNSGLDRYYRFREAEAITAPQELDRLALAWQACDERRDLWGEALAGGRYDLLLQTEGVRCAACAWLIRSRLEPLPGVERVQVDIGSGYTRIVWDPERIAPSRIALELARIGYQPHLPLGEEEERARLDERRRSMRRMGVAGLGMMQVMMYAVGLYAGEAFGISAGAERFLEWTSLLVSIPVVFYSGRVFITGALDSLRAGRPGMDVPVALAISVAFTASCVNFLRGEGHVYFDSVTMFIFFLSVARHVQLVQRQRNASAGAALARLLPEWAERVDADGAALRVLASELAAGDRVRVRPGEPFPADGRVLEGETRVDEALLTGESTEVRKHRGDTVIGGSVNRSQAVTVRITAVGRDSTLSAMGRMLLRARVRGSRIASMADRLAGWFVVGVLAAAAFTASFWLLRDPSVAMPAVLAVLVVSCPCALSLATPAALSAASRALLREGILLTRGDALEALARADVAVFDKTGTLTRGTPVIERVVLNPDRADLDERRVRELAAALEAHSAHPLARAFALDGVPAASRDVTHEPGGSRGEIGGVAYRLGAAAFAGVDEAREPGAPGGVWLTDPRGWVAHFELSDPLRPGGEELFEHLRREGLRLLVLSGDAAPAVERVARRLGADEWRARQDPAAKTAAVRDLQEAGHTVLMMGDGVNDAPVLATADVSMTVQGATELAHSAADLILTGESLALAARARDKALQTRRLVRQNIAWAVSYNLLAIPLAVTGHLQPWMAALGMSASSMLVVGNAARLAARGGAEPPASPALRAVTQS